MMETGPAESSEPRGEHPAKERMHKGKSDNKNLFIFRNEYYKTHCEEFNVSITNAIAKFNKERFEELEYKHKWDEMINKLKEAIAVKDKDILNEEKKDNVVLNK